MIEEVISLEKNFVYALAAVIVVATASLLFFAFAKPAVDPTKLARCLTERGWTMYGATWCSHCAAQKKAFGDAVQYLDVVECDEKPFECQANDIEGTPTWLNRDGSIKLVGEQSLDTLALESGCSEAIK